MKQVTKLCLLIGTLNTVSNAIEAFSPEHSELGYFDTKMERVLEDGRRPDVQSVFEQRRLWKEQQAAAQSEDHPLLSAGKYTDVPMEMLWDFNHVVKIKFHNETKDLELIPTTGTSELVLLHNNCSKCWSMHGAKWEAD